MDELLIPGEVHEPFFHHSIFVSASGVVALGEAELSMIYTIISSDSVNRSGVYGTYLCSCRFLIFRTNMLTLWHVNIKS